MKLAVELVKVNSDDIVATKEKPKEIQLLDRVSYFTHNLFELSNHLVEYLDSKASTTTTHESSKNDEPLVVSEDAEPEVVEAKSGTSNDAPF